ncbi:MAG: DNA double-strand break repair protein Mre11 [Halobacteriota archaeon]
MTRVIHTGDTHIGYQQYHSPERRQDFLDAFEQVVDDAVSGDADAVVHAGDLFHDRRPDLQDLLGTLTSLRRLSEADVPFLAVVGNHEATRGGQWLDLFERLGLAVRLGSTPYVLGDTAFYGLDHVPESRRDALDYEFEPHEATYAVLVSHGLFTPFAHANWDTETVLAESNVDFDAVLLGDNHVADTAEVSGTWVTYCGSTERASASEEDGRGYNLVEFGRDDASVDIRRRSLDTRPFAFVTVELAEGEGVERVREQVRQHDLTDAVTLVELTGEGDPVAPADIESFASERGALIARVTDRREIEHESELSVSFADPDDAVRERVGELGLSAAARDVDETVRASKVADSNVREEVKNRVATLVDSELEAFEPAPETEPAEEASPRTGDETARVSDVGDADEATDGCASGGSREEIDSRDGDAIDDEEPISDPDDTIVDEAVVEPTAEATVGTEERGREPDTVDDGATETATDETDDQRSMEDFL